jgi:hypothetical protein
MSLLIDINMQHMILDLQICVSLVFKLYLSIYYKVIIRVSDVQLIGCFLTKKRMLLFVDKQSLLASAFSSIKQGL